MTSLPWEPAEARHELIGCLCIIQPDSPAIIIYTLRLFNSKTSIFTIDHSHSTNLALPPPATLIYKRASAYN
ncbi:hypothetical protein HZ326_12232 [Fusarium oxysporum f. sp. albedinis]|nr:hypothetical protein HZ326_12232 [Fusarium oxysporum f. sp. albedinis]